MGSIFWSDTNTDKLYEGNKVNISMCQTEQDSEIINTLKNSLFPNGNLEYKNKIEIQDPPDYIYFKGENYGLINEECINTIASKISGDKSGKNIVICFLSDDHHLKMIKEKLFGIEEECLPFIVLVKINEFFLGLNEVRKLSQINIIKYFASSSSDINESNTLKTYNILYSKLLQIDAYLNERGTFFRNYLFGLMNNVQGDINANIRMDDIAIGNRSALNIFLFGNPRAGKSRFINLSMNELISRERDSSQHTTKKFTQYELPKRHNYEGGDLGQIVLYDTPGLTEDQDVMKQFKDLV